jgi:RHS repeat-associated protein
VENYRSSANTANPTPNEKPSHLIQPPAVNLPKGGGAIKGIGEKFSVNAVNGTASFDIPIYTSPGRSGFGPKLSLSYNSGSGNGPFGWGWNLGIPSITRKTDKGLPRYLDNIESDVFILSGAEDLVPLLVKKGDDWEKAPIIEHEIQGIKYQVKRYRPRIEGLFARIEQWKSLDGEIHWRTISKDNIVSLYGDSVNSRIAESTKGIFTWLLSATFDDKGNVVVYNYKKENIDNIPNVTCESNRKSDFPDANRYLKNIYYCNKNPFLGTRAIDFEKTGWNPDWLMEVVFDYGENHYIEEAPDTDKNIYVAAQIKETAGQKWLSRLDPFSSYRSGFEVRTYRLCQRVLMFHHFKEELNLDDYLVRSTEFNYTNPQVISMDDAEDESSYGAYLYSATQSGYVYKNGKYLKRSYPQVEFTYSSFNRDRIANDFDVKDVSINDRENVPVGLSSGYQTVDLNGEGISGIFKEESYAWYYKPNLGNGTFGQMKEIACKPTTAILSKGTQLLDLAGDGSLDVVNFAGPTPGFYERTENDNWSAYQPFSSLPNINWNDPNLRFIDLTGDGHADILITEQDVFRWHNSFGEDGFDEEQRIPIGSDENTAPSIVFANGEESIYLADMSGDGLNDIVRIRNGDVCYWPNLGYGHFGKKVSMGNAPWFDYPDQFESSRIRLADIDGTGITDVIYLSSSGVKLFYNQSGNSWSKEHVGPILPIDNLVTVQVTDFLGKGTACLVWSSPAPADSNAPLKYVDLMADRKPGLLIKMENNLGAETVLEYVSSTKFYLQDKQKGKPWITKLPFPVHVLERSIVYDRISKNRFISRYEYHHGYFDGIEREFRGFGMVEQWDTEELSILANQGLPENTTNIDSASYVPPVHTKTWYHTGAYLDGDRISKCFAKEYYREPMLSETNPDELLLPDTILPDDVSFEEAREACRALKGTMLRQEVYSDDGTDKKSHPYSVVEQCFGLRKLQLHGSNPNAVFLCHPSETITYHYERNPVDPRMQHSITLEIDDFGNVVKDVTIAYARRKKIIAIKDNGETALVDNPALEKLTSEEKDKLLRNYITVNEVTPTNAIEQLDNDYRVPVAAETYTYELTGYPFNTNKIRYTKDEFVKPADRGPSEFQMVFDEEIDYEKPATNGRQRRLIERVRVQFRPNDCGIAQNNDSQYLLPLGIIESKALQGETYKLSLTSGIIDATYGTKMPSANAKDVLSINPTAQTSTDRGGYVDLDNNGNWWIPSGRVYLSPNSKHTAQEELHYAGNHFYLPCRYRDPLFTDTFITESVITFDPYDLLVLESRDPMDNRVTIGERKVDGSILPGNDYRVLQPQKVMDPNENCSEVAFDALGLVVGTAIMGKPNASIPDGDSLEGFETDLSIDIIAAHMNSPFSDPIALVADWPHAILRDATTRLVYDLFAYVSTKNQTAPLPAVVYTIVRETHLSDELNGIKSKVQHSFSYSDGFGREIQKKIQAEQGKVPKRDANDTIVVDEIGQPVMVDNAKPNRWVGSGWTIFNNKGKPVLQFEPFFTDRHTFECDQKIGVSSISFYDPVNRVVAVLHPNHTWEKTVFDAWMQTSWDVNDTILFNPTQDQSVRDYFIKVNSTVYTPTWYDLRTKPEHANDLKKWYPDPNTRNAEQQAADKAKKHHDTPSTVYLDPLGRTIRTDAHNGYDSQNKPILFSTRVIYGIEGNQREVYDAKNRLVMKYSYDMLSNRIYQLSMEANARWMLSDITGKPIRSWDSRGHQFKTKSDLLHRPVEHYVQGTDIAESDSRTLNQEILFEKIVYGEGQPNDVDRNLRTQPYKSFDGSGISTSDYYDFKGNLKRGVRELVKDYKGLADWSNTPIMEPEVYVSTTMFDALNRPIQLIAPHNEKNVMSIKTDVIQPRYNEANLLDAIDVWMKTGTPSGLLTNNPSNNIITNIEYDSKGRRTLVYYGNRARTKYEYDPLTFRLARLFTTRAKDFIGDCNNPNPCNDSLNDCPKVQNFMCGVQNLFYTYDPAGNITNIRDNAQQTIYFNGVCVEPSASYEYDPIYRLVKADGREFLGLDGKPTPLTHSDAPRDTQFHPNDGNKLGRYSQEYFYDEVGNFEKLVHSGSSGGWKRDYKYEAISLTDSAQKSNRLTKTILGSNNPIDELYSYDLHGNMKSMPHITEINWDFKDQLLSIDLQGGGQAYYSYDASGQRIRKVWVKQNGEVEERLYISNEFEIYSKKDSAGTIKIERETMHVMDDKQQVALIETKTIENITDVEDTSIVGVPLIRYQFSNHLGSSNLELDDIGEVISYEEYFPYGITSYLAVNKNIKATRKRYRYTGKERDEESGLYYYGARYYASWLGRWIACDPIGIRDSINEYQYARNDPIKLFDFKGFETRDSQEGIKIPIHLNLTEPLQCGGEENALTDYKIELDVSDFFDLMYSSALEGDPYAADLFAESATFVAELGRDNANDIFRSTLYSSLGFGKDSFERFKDVFGNGPGGNALFSAFQSGVLYGLENPKMDWIDYLGETLAFIAFLGPNAGKTGSGSNPVKTLNDASLPESVVGRIRPQKPGEPAIPYGNYAHGEMEKINAGNLPKDGAKLNTGEGKTGPDLPNPKEKNAEAIELKSIYENPARMFDQVANWQEKRGIPVEAIRHQFYDPKTGYVFEGIVQWEKYIPEWLEGLPDELIKYGFRGN